MTDIIWFQYFIKENRNRDIEKSCLKNTFHKGHKACFNSMNTSKNNVVMATFALS